MTKDKLKTTTKNPRFLYIMVLSNDGDDVNIRIPLILVKLLMKFHHFIPSSARKAMENEGFDLNQFIEEVPTEELLEAVKEFDVNIVSSDGDTVRIFCE
ncbi:MAG: hypothetical protein ABGX21_01430 [Candidatus Poseidoniia archaeon]|jgi:hypothetical protein|nr:hypothetical protein [Candidatus Poseidoniales archaeon]